MTNIILNCDADPKEIGEIRNLSRECGLERFSISKAGGKRHIAADFPPELIVAISLMVSAVAGGFLNAIGSDLWGKLKQFIRKITGYYENQSGGQEIYNADIILDFQERGKPVLQIVFKRSSLKSFKNAIKELEDKLAELDFRGRLTRLDYDGNKWVFSSKVFKNQHEEYSEFMQKDANKK